MRKGIMGVGALLIVVGLVQLILLIVMVGGIVEGVKTQVEGLDPVLDGVTGALTEAADSLDGGVSLLRDMDTTLADAEKIVGEQFAGIISDVREDLTIAQTYVGDVGNALHAVTKDIEGVDVSGMTNGVVDEVVGPLRTYMILNSILFMLAGAGLLLTGLHFIRTKA